ncbi:aminoglycoside phosphotransferase family protein [Streptomyces albulus]|uniref:aminoglycoside phosphotransferase family protein n=1 Tax=Streptomyces noursei TaxID=1971 RepID=UPI001F166FE1|nr:aminoglycoside phosphotransferase family protein [Streptomyces noursei]MCE4948860.1 aminoglycoside phosphotransferase family protein [Streptomyces noursei]
MRDDASRVVDRGRYPTAVTPWEDPDWRDAALGWARDELAAHGLRVTGPGRVRLRPWSVLVRLPVAGRGAVWFKANPPGSAFEAGLTAALARWAPGHVLAPLAADAARAWLLLPDGGELFRDVLDRAPADPRAWEQPLAQYAALQRTLLPHVPDLARLGVPGAPTAGLPDLFDRLVAENPVLPPDDRARLRALRPRLAGWCADLADLGIADTLDHADLHDGQLFAPQPGRFTFFDWGDAALSHPFCSFLVPALAARERYGPDVLPRLRDAYLEPWTGGGLAAAELRRAMRPAWRLGTLGRVRAWGRLFPAPADEPGDAAPPGAAESAAWLCALHSDDSEPPV